MDDPPADLYRQLLAREARLERLIRQLLRDDLPREPPATAARQAPAAMSTDQTRLTKREGQILRLLVTGSANHQIGEELKLSAGTVRNHLSRIYRKLGVTTRTQAAVRVTELGLVSADPYTPRSAGDAGPCCARQLRTARGSRVHPGDPEGRLG